MTSFLGELGKKLADRWMSLLVLPGVLLLATVAVAAVLGHRSALDVELLVSRADGWARTLSARPGVALALLFVAVLLASAAVGLAVRGMAGLTWRLWLGLWPGFCARPFTAHRQHRWSAADARGRADLRNRIALARPSRPTWMGDRVAVVADRVRHQYDVDLASWWPRLWLTVDEPTRAELQAARAAFETTVTQASWAYAYAVVALFWWPAAPVALGVWITGRARARTTLDAWCDLIESTVDVHAGELARRLGVLADGDRFGRATGEELTALFRKGT